jgi:hypothetical protein
LGNGIQVKARVITELSKKGSQQSPEIALGGILGVYIIVRDHVRLVSREFDVLDNRRAFT